MLSIYSTRKHIHPTFCRGKMQYLEYEIIVFVLHIVSHSSLPLKCDFCHKHKMQHSIVLSIFHANEVIKIIRFSFLQFLHIDNGHIILYLNSFHFHSKLNNFNSFAIEASLCLHKNKYTSRICLHTDSSPEVIIHR